MKTVIIQKDNKNTSPLTSMESIYDIYPLLTSSKAVGPWVFTHPTTNVSTDVILPYSVNGTDGHSSSYEAKRNYEFTSTITIHKLLPTYLWFTYATQAATIYINGTSLGMYKGNYSAFFVDITNYIIIGTNTVKVEISNLPFNEGTVPISGDFNFNAALGEVRILTSPVLPDTKYGYDGFHITSTVTSLAATVTIETSVPNYADVVCHIKDGEYNFTERKFGKGVISFTTTINNPHLWHGKVDPHLYDITLEIYYDGELCHKLNRGYGFRYYEYVIDDTEKVGDAEHPYTGFLLNGQKYLLRGVNTHHDLAGKANALSSADIDHDFDIIRELGCNFMRLAHYPHPKKVYDYCDKLGIVIQTEIPWVNTAESSLGDTRKAAIKEQIYDMVMLHYNHPCIIFWGLANEISGGTAENTKAFLESLRAYIRTLDTSRLVGFVMSHSNNSASAFGYPDLDWFGCNIYVGWYVDKTSNNPTNQINTRKTNFITNKHKALAFSEYGCGGNNQCHSENWQSTTQLGTSTGTTDETEKRRHDIEYQMWLHEGHIAAIKNYPELIFTSQWVLFDFAVSNRHEGFTICLDGETTSYDDSYKYLNNKGLVERDHITKKDTFYLYKAWWNTTDIFVHICGKNYTKKTSRVIKCYSNDTGSFNLYVNGKFIETATVTNNIITFTARNYSVNDTIKVLSTNAVDSFIIDYDENTAMPDMAYNTLDILYANSNGDIIADAHVLNPSLGYTPIGLCVAGSEFFGEDEPARFMSLKYMDCLNPDNGSLIPTTLRWGTTDSIENLDSFSSLYVHGGDFGYLNTSWQTTENLESEYILPSVFDASNEWNINELGEVNEYYMTDINGKDNTSTIIATVTVLPNWQTDTSIINYAYVEGAYTPLACCCARYYTNGTTAGDWYLGSGAELCIVGSLRNEINAKLAQISNIYPNDCINELNAEYNYGSSTLRSGSYIYELDISIGCVDADAQGGYSLHTLAMYQL